MRRILCSERDDWRDTARAMGFGFHSADGVRYWDESAYYAFTLEEIERRIEGPTAEIDAMCRELVASVVKDERALKRLDIPQAYWDFIAESWKRGDQSLYGRIDLRFDGSSPAKLLEYNADTPTSLFEAAVFQWTWLEQAIERQIVPKRADQFNSIHERLIEGWRSIAGGRDVHFAGIVDNPEDYGNLQYLEDVARQAGSRTTMIDVEQIGVRKGRFVDQGDRDIALAFKFYPWEWMFREVFGKHLATSSTQWIEPPWKAILSNKGLLPLLWEMFPGHPNLLAACFENETGAADFGTSYARKPLCSREGANVSLVSAGTTLLERDGPYGNERFVRQALAPLPCFDGHHPVLGSWIVKGEACGLSIREDATPITGNASRFVPHVIL